MNVAVGSLISGSNNVKGQKPIKNFLTQAVGALTDLNGMYCLDLDVSSDHEYGSNVDPKVLAMVFWNANLMERIISYVPLIKDRINIEKCCRRMRDLSKRAAYLKSGADCTLLDMHFQRTKPEITIAFSGNEVILPVTVASCRFSSTEGLASQPAASIAKLDAFLRRFEKEILSLRIGSIHDIQRRMSYITDHELVLTPDLCEILTKLRNLRSLCIRNCHMSCQVLDEWSSDKSRLMQQIQSFCFHGVWFDKSADCDRLMNILKSGVCQLHLSKCGTEILCQLASRVSRLGIKLDYIFLLLNVHSVNREYLTKQALERLSEVCRELRICVCLSTLDVDEERLVLNKTLGFIVEFPKITVLELDIGIPDTKGLKYYQRFFQGLRNLPNLRTLRISSIALRNYHLPIWKQMVCGIAYLKKVTELAIRGIGGRLSSQDIQSLCEFLPKNLKILTLYLAKNFRGQHLRLIADRCDKLEVLLILGAREIDSHAVFYAFTKLHCLQSIALSHVGHVPEFLVNLLCNKEATSSLDAVSFGSLHHASFSSNTLALLNRRFQHIKTAHNFFSEEKLNEGIETTHLYRSQKGFQRILDGMSFGECPGCEKDLTLFDEDF